MLSEKNKKLINIGLNKILLDLKEDIDSHEDRKKILILLEETRNKIIEMQTH